jgi:hypothetical protein
MPVAPERFDPPATIATCTVPATTATTAAAKIASDVAFVAALTEEPKL